MTIVIAVCALVGAIAGIAGSAAAPSSSKKALTAKKQQLRREFFRFHRGFKGRFLFGPGPFMMMGGPIHSETVVPKPDGSGFDTITTDGGALNGVDGTTVDIKEGTDKATYKDSVKIDVGSDARVTRDGKDAKLSDLQAGDHVHVIQSPKGNLVFAADDAFIKQMRKDRGPRTWGPPGDFDHPGPPPPGAPGPAPGDQGGSNENGSSSGSSSSGSNS